jgi:hypothetical protein
MYEFVFCRDEKRVMFMRSRHAKLDVYRLQRQHILFDWVSHNKNVYVVDEISFDDVDLWINALIY